MKKGKMEGEGGGSCSGDSLWVENTRHTTLLRLIEGSAN